MKLSHRHHGSQTTVRVMKPLVAHLANTLCLWQSCTYVGYLSVGEWWGLPNTERHLRLCPESSEEVHASKRDKRSSPTSRARADGLVKLLSNGVSDDLGL
jgi:hypothetical protein